MSGKYILNENGCPVHEPDLEKWSHWFETSDSQRNVERTVLRQGIVSTCFLGLDFSMGGKTPVLWETFVLSGKLQGRSDRCGGNKEQAEAMHLKMVRRVLAEA